MTHERQSAHHESGLRAAQAVWRRRKWVAMLVFVVPFSSAVSLIVAMPNLYRAETTVLVQQDPGSDAAGGSVADGFESRLQTINEEIRSRSRLIDLIKRFDLYPNLRQNASPEQVIERMRRDIRLERKEVALRWGQGSTFAFVLSYQGWDPQTAADVTNALASMYVNENEKLRQPAAVGKAAAGPDTLAQLKRKLADLRTRFNDRYPDIVQLKAEIAARQRQGHNTGLTHSAPRKEQLRIIDSALPPTLPVAPHRLRLLLMGLIFSLGAAGAAAFLAEQFDTSFHRLDELWTFTNMPILACIPRIATRADVWRRRLRAGLVGILTVSVLALVVQASFFLGQTSEKLVWILAQRGT